MFAKATTLLKIRAITAGHQVQLDFVHIASASQNSEGGTDSVDVTLSSEKIQPLTHCTVNALLNAETRCSNEFGLSSLSF
jgi:hypothetical protein